MRRGRRRRSRAEVDDVIDLRDGEVIDLRSEPTERDDEYHCMTIHLNVEARDDAARAWEEAGSLIDYPPDLAAWRADARRDGLVPGQVRAGVLDLDERDT